MFARVRRRKKYGIAALTFTDCATVVSGSVDAVERSLGFTHRTTAHSPPLLGGLWATARLIKRAKTKAVQWICDRIRYSGNIKLIIQELDEFATWILDGGFVGMLTHILGDIPGTGRGGTALSALYPFSRKSFNLGLVSSVSTAVSKVTAVIGTAISAASWTIIGSHIVSPELPETSIRNALSSLSSISWEAVKGKLETFYEQVTKALAQVENVFRDAFTTAGNGLCSWAHRVRVSVQDLLNVSGDNPYPDMDRDLSFQVS